MSGEVREFDVVLGGGIAVSPLNRSVAHLIASGPGGSARTRPIPPERLLQILSTRHVPGLTRRQLQVLAATELGYSAYEIAAGLDRSPATVRRHLADLEQRVFTVTGLVASHVLLAKWTREHYDCCTRPCLQLFNDRRLFESG